MRVKISIPGKKDEILKLPEGCDVETFKGLVVSLFEEEILPKGFRFGFPPQTLLFEGNEQRSLDDLGVSNGERIIINLEVASGNTADGASTTSKNEQKNKPSSDRNNVGEHASLDNRRRIQIHEVPDDNSCLFHAIGYAVYKDISFSSDLRKAVSTAIRQDPITYSDAILGKPNKEYSEWILKQNSWGGGIEIAILSKHLNYAIYVLDIDACKFEKFNDDVFSKYIIIAYNGIHYDTVEVVEDNIHSTVFDLVGEKKTAFLKKMEEIAANMKKAGRTFNTARDTILCNVCGETLVGEREVGRHAEKMRHFDFRQK